MSTITLRLTATCSGGNHHRIAVTGDIARTFTLDSNSELFDFAPEDIELFARMLIAFAKRGRTAAQVKSALTTGVTVTL